MFGAVRDTIGDTRKDAFDELRALPAVHEAAEELIVRPVAKRTAGKAETDARNKEEAEATRDLKRLEDMDVGSPEFLTTLAEFERAVGEHADREESEEFPALLQQCSVQERHTMGERLTRPALVPAREGRLPGRLRTRSYAVVRPPPSPAPGAQCAYGEWRPPHGERRGRLFGWQPMAGTSVQQCGAPGRE